MHWLITIGQDLDAVTSILYQTFEIPPFKRNYDSAFGQISTILPFTLCMQEFFDSISQDQWRTGDLTFIKQSEEFAITKFKDWIIGKIT